MSAYRQTRLDDEDKPKTAFRTHLGHYQYTGLNFGTIPNRVWVARTGGVEPAPAEDRGVVVDAARELTAIQSVAQWLQARPDQPRQPHDVGRVEHLHPARAQGLG